MTLDPPAEPRPDPSAETGAEPRDQSEKPRRGDKPPKPRAKGKGGRPKGTGTGKPGGAALKSQSVALEKKLGELLTFPAVPAAMAYQHDPIGQMYMVDHFTRSGPRTAAVLVELSETNDQLRAILIAATSGGGWLGAGVALAAYAVPPVMFAVLGMREQAARITAATTMTPEELQRMMADDAAAAQATAAEGNGAPGPEGPAFAAEPDPGAG